MTDPDLTAALKKVKLPTPIEDRLDKMDAKLDRLLAASAFDQAHEASRRAKDLQDERYEIKPVALDRIKDSDAGLVGPAKYNDDAERRLPRKQRG